MDFVQIKERSLKKDSIELYPEFLVRKSRDLMVRGKSFYAIWDEEKGIVYKDEPYKTEFANGEIYILRRRYMVIFITRDPDDTTLEKLASMPYSKLDRIYTADNLYHYAFIIHH